jgi:putative transcriptional regulator
MKEELFEELMASVGEALEHARGKRELRTTVLPPPPAPMDAEAVKKVRKKLNASQAVFAHCLNVSTKLVQAWEAGRRTPDGPALLLLRLAEKDPAIVVRRAGGGRTKVVA